MKEIVEVAWLWQFWGYNRENQSIYSARNISYFTKLYHKYLYYKEGDATDVAMWIYSLIIHINSNRDTSNICI